mmetsp:Transcript_28422/g.76721  ORF Transcript_28422/g.76721 Transcript_28422/m.76721 type:complete len:205 (-) Transcript_28422:228-842(-)
MTIPRWPAHNARSSPALSSWYARPVGAGSDGPVPLHQACGCASTCSLNCCKCVTTCTELSCRRCQVKVSSLGARVRKIAPHPGSNARDRSFGSGYVPMREATRCSPSDVSFSKRPCHAAVKEDEFGSHTDSTSKYTSSELQPAAGRACSKAPGLILVWAAGASDMLPGNTAQEGCSRTGLFRLGPFAYAGGFALKQAPMCPKTS